MKSGALDPARLFGRLFPSGLTSKRKGEIFMKPSRFFALLLTLAMMLTLSPGAVGYAADEQGEPERQEAEIVLLAASTGWQPKPTWTVSNKSSFPLTLKSGDVLQINGPIDYTAPTGKSPITVAAGASVKIIINGSVTLHGANADGTKGATAAIYVPEGASLMIYSAHDEELSTSTAAPKDSLTVSGGNAAAGANGTDGKKEEKDEENIQQKTIYWVSGDGGDGGGGAAAAIGGNGGNGGAGAKGGCDTKKDQYITESTWGGRQFYNTDDHKGTSGSKGGSGSSGSGAGTIYIAGRLTLSATGGSGAAGGNGGSGCGGQSYFRNTRDRMLGGNGGGGGGGGGCNAPAFGAGGAGGSGGGSGGHAGSDMNGNVQGPGGGGGGGGWPNGGGGGGGGSECSNTNNGDDNTSKGGAGGAGGSFGSAGSLGGTGTQAGTKDHGLNDAKPGYGGYGASGQQGIGGSAGSGGLEKDRGKNECHDGGDGGAGGEPVDLTAWHSAGSLILSTAVNLRSGSYGDGGGKGSSTALTPYVIYDLMDCKVTLSASSYTYTGSQIRPTIRSVSYSASTDRDGRQTAGSSSTVSSSGYTVSYGANLHCPTGTMSLLGKQNANRTTVRTNGAVIGSVDLSFTINKARLTAPISLSTTSPYLNQSVTATLNQFTSPTAGTGSLSGLLRESTQKAEGPQVNWVLTSNSGQITEVSDLKAVFVITRSVGSSVSIQAALRDMNDFENCTMGHSVTPQTPRTWTTTLSSDTPHPRVPLSVVLPSGISSATYQWYANGSAISGATAQSYTPTISDVGKTLSVEVVPSPDTGYAQLTVTAKAAVEAHRYSANGFCSVCDEYQPASLSGSVYQIANGGQMFWFAALVNGDGAHAVFSEKNAAASAVLTRDIDLENREWAPIGGNNNDYTGSFNGQEHTVSKLFITKTNSYTGFFGRTTGIIQNFTVEGSIALSATGTRIGGAVGTAYGGAVYGVCSRVSISDSNIVAHHIGGVVGGVDSPETIIENCLFEGTLEIGATTDCVGGIVGYSNGDRNGNGGARIRYCANLGTVRTAAQGAYTGGILGYVNNAGPAIRNCYNYGLVQNGGGSYCGAIVGRVRTHNSSKYTDNYYLASSAPAGFGAGSSSTTVKIVAKDAAAFQSGEVCYFLNGSSSDSDVVWRQDVDNGNTPYDLYPVFKGGIVLQNRAHHDCTANTYLYAYSNSPKSEDHINHQYVNGFCSCCDALQPAEAANGVYSITNGGQFFWFAGQINSGALAQNSAAALLSDVDLEGSRDGQAAGYEGIVKSRNFPCVGTSAKHYQGTFTGNGHTVADLMIQSESKTDALVEGIGLFGYIENAAISGLTVQGSISISRKTGDEKLQRVGGVVGAAYKSELSELTSYVNITGTGEEETPHVGGVAGEATDGSSLFKCLYFGAIDLKNTTDCVGGVVAYINDTSVRYCANLGLVRSGTVGAYLGGVVGYLNNDQGIIRNCYNYGSLQNDGGSHCGAIVGWMRKHTAGSLTDNYYLTGSAPGAFGSGSNSTTAVAPEKDSAAFQSGEVCYLLNGKISTEDAIWRQNIDNGITPYQVYPVFNAAIVYDHSDYTYSNNPEEFSVTIRWGAMEFDYHAGRWNPATHTYSGSWAPAEDGGDALTVTNEGNVAVRVSLNFSADAAFTKYDLTGEFNGAASGEVSLARSAVLSSRLNLHSLNPEDLLDQGKKKLGEITVVLKTLEGDDNG